MIDMLLIINEAIGACNILGIFSANKLEWLIASNDD